MHASPPSSNPAEGTLTRVSVAWAGPLLDLACAVAAQKWVVIFILLLGGTLGFVRLARMPPIYTASSVAVLLPREKPILDVAIDTSSVEASDDSARRSSSGSLMLPPNPTLYTTLIFSRPVLSRVEEAFADRLTGHLSPRDRSDEVVEQIRSMISVKSTEEGLITITVQSRQAQLSADIANELFAECEKASKSIERQLILQQAGHLDRALEISLVRLRQTEQSLSNFAAQYGLIDVGLQASNSLRALRELATEIDRLDADLQELAFSHSEKSPEMQRLRARKAALEAQLSGGRAGVGGAVKTDDFGRLMVDYESLQQKIRFERDLVATLSTKVDIYRLRADQPTGNLAVIRAATTPDRPSGPSKKRELGLVLGLVVVLSLGWSIGIQQLRRILADESLTGQFAELATLLHPRLRRLFEKTQPTEGPLGQKA